MLSISFVKVGLSHTLPFSKLFSLRANLVSFAFRLPIQITPVVIKEIPSGRTDTTSCKLTLRVTHVVLCSCPLPLIYPGLQFDTVITTARMVYVLKSFSQVGLKYVRQISILLNLLSCQIENAFLASYSLLGWCQSIQVRWFSYVIP